MAAPISPAGHSTSTCSPTAGGAQTRVWPMRGAAQRIGPVRKLSSISTTHVPAVRSTETTWPKRISSSGSVRVLSGLRMEAHWPWPGASGHGARL
jgi:hypothetical protein